MRTCIGAHLEQVLPQLPAAHPTVPST